MSADSWAICPRCVAQARAEYDKNVEAVMATYGKVPVEEFDAARAALVAPAMGDFQTFREDYEFYGAEAGEVEASYSGHCSKCGLGLDFKVSRKFWPEPST
jgi:hypothetical protein